MRGGERAIGCVDGIVNVNVICRYVVEKMPPFFLHWKRLAGKEENEGNLQGFHR